MPNVELDWQQIDKVITDDQLSFELKERIERNGVQVIIAN